ncbi:hypothetical protein Ciccas_002906 [Cichlidogyrus casuarinus]|uniref:Uncharacterized protein n=1 Tax=Cichlidogyrus casuarinus TaxID=1844966 RepID=A0ABD2QFX8_9PLAT
MEDVETLKDPTSVEQQSVHSPLGDLMQDESRLSSKSQILMWIFAFRKKEGQLTQVQRDEALIWFAETALKKGQLLNAFNTGLLKSESQVIEAHLAAKDDPGVLFNVYVAQARYQEALELYEAAQLRKSDQRAFVFSGQFLKDPQEPTKMISIFSKATELIAKNLPQRLQTRPRPSLSALQFKTPMVARKCPLTPKRISVDQFTTPQFKTPKLASALTPTPISPMLKMLFTPPASSLPKSSPGDLLNVELKTPISILKSSCSTRKNGSIGFMLDDDSHMSVDEVCQQPSKTPESQPNTFKFSFSRPSISVPVPPINQSTGNTSDTSACDQERPTTSFMEDDHEKDQQESTSEAIEVKLEAESGSRLSESPTTRIYTFVCEESPEAPVEPSTDLEEKLEAESGSSMAKSPVKRMDRISGDKSPELKNIQAPVEEMQVEESAASETSFMESAIDEDDHACEGIPIEEVQVEQPATLAKELEAESGSIVSERDQLEEMASSEDTIEMRADERVSRSGSLVSTLDEDDHAELMDQSVLAEKTLEMRVTAEEIPEASGVLCVASVCVLGTSEKSSRGYHFPACARGEKEAGYQS